jgi:hypothetical protein
MFVLLICVYLSHVQQWYRSSINSRIPSNTGPAQGTHGREAWRAAQAILAISTEVLGRLLPTIAYLMPTYGPIVIALMIGCTALAVRVPSGSNSDKCYEAKSLEDAA